MTVIFSLTEILSYTKIFLNKFEFFQRKRLKCFEQLRKNFLFFHRFSSNFKISSEDILPGLRVSGCGCLSVFLFVCVSVCLCFCLSVCLCFCLSVFLFVCVSVCLFVFLFGIVCVSVYLFVSVCRCFCLSICVSMRLCVCRSDYICLSLCLLVCLSSSQTPVAKMTDKLR